MIGISPLSLLVPQLQVFLSLAKEVIQVQECFVLSADLVLTASKDY